MKTADRTSIQRHPERSVPDAFAAIMGAGEVVHIAFDVGRQPHVIPVGYHYNDGGDGCVYVHGSPDSRLMKHLASGEPVCLCVTIVDAVVCSRHAMMHSMNYRSAIGFGRGKAVEDLSIKRRIFEEMTSRYIDGRTAGVDYEPATDAQLASTLVVGISIEERSAKMRTGGPTGITDNRPDAFGTCGIAPFNGRHLPLDSIA